MKQYRFPRHRCHVGEYLDIVCHDARTVLLCARGLQSEAGAAVSWPVGALLKRHDIVQLYQYERGAFSKRTLWCSVGP
jgi:hypothetical protein